MIDYYKNELMNEWQIKSYQSFGLTMDVLDYVPAKYLKKIHKSIYKCMKQQKRRIDGENRAYQRTLSLLIKAGAIPDTTSKDVVLADYLKHKKEADNEQENK